MPQLTFTTSNQSLLNNNLWPLYELLSSSLPLSVQLQLLIWIPYTETSFQLSLVTQLLQNTSLQITNSLWTQIVFSFLTTESMYYLLVISAHMSSSIIMIISLPDIIKYWNLFAMNTHGPASMLMYNSSASSMSLVCDPSNNVISLTNISNNYRIPFVQTSSRNFCYSLCLTLSQLQSTSLPSRQSLFLPITSLCL